MLLWPNTMLKQSQMGGREAGRGRGGEDETDWSLICLTPRSEALQSHYHKHMHVHTREAWPGLELTPSFPDGAMYLAAVRGFPGLGMTLAGGAALVKHLCVRLGSPTWKLCQLSHLDSLGSSWEF